MSPKRGGVTLVELAVAMVVAGVVLAAAWGLLATLRFTWRDQALVLEVRRNVRAAALVLEEELRWTSPVEGDVTAASDTAVTFKALRALGALCAAPAVPTATVVLRDALTSGLRAIDPARDSILLYRDGEPLLTGDDRWIHAGVTAVSPGATCADGTAGTRVALAGPGAAPAELAGVGEGAPVRVVEAVSYRLYADAAGQWWLGTRNFTAGSWSATSPVAGPLRPRDGLELGFLDTAGAPATTPADIAQVVITIRGRGQRPMRAGSRRWSPYQDSVTTLVAPRNE